MVRTTDCLIWCNGGGRGRWCDDGNKITQQPAIKEGGTVAMAVILKMEGRRGWGVGQGDNKGEANDDWGFRDRCLIAIVAAAATATATSVDNADTT